MQTCLVTIKKLRTHPTEHNMPPRRDGTLPVGRVEARSRSPRSKSPVAEEKKIKTSRKRPGKVRRAQLHNAEKSLEVEFEKDQGEESADMRSLQRQLEDWMHTYVHMHIRSYVHTSIHTDIHSIA